MLKSLLFPWKHNKTKRVAAVTTTRAPQLQRLMDQELIIQEGNLLPCHVCGRTFLPTPLAKHEKVCERNSAKKRKPFDSLKQRVAGTDLAQFHQTTYLKKKEEPVILEAKGKQNKWKEKHLELVTAIRAAKGVPSTTRSKVPSSPMMRQRGSLTSLTQNNEQCQFCERFFGFKAFDRHVEWCKERKLRIQEHLTASAQQAKERLEARVKYRVPPLNKSKRTTVKEKYSNSQSPEPLPVRSVNSTTNLSLSRTPSIRKPKSLFNVEKSTIKQGISNNKGDGDKKPINNINNMSMSFDASILQSPKAESIKRRNPVVAKKLNSIHVNERVQGLIVSAININNNNKDKMVTWKEIVKKESKPHQETKKLSLLPNKFNVNLQTKSQECLKKGRELDKILSSDDILLNKGRLSRIPTKKVNRRFKNVESFLKNYQAQEAKGSCFDRRLKGVDELDELSVIGSKDESFVEEIEAVEDIEGLDEKDTLRDVDKEEDGRNSVREDIDEESCCKANEEDTKLEEIDKNDVHSDTDEDKCTTNRSEDIFNELIDERNFLKALEEEMDKIQKFEENDEEDANLEKADKYTWKIEETDNTETHNKTESQSEGEINEKSKLKDEDGDKCTTETNSDLSHEEKTEKMQKLKENDKEDADLEEPDKDTQSKQSEERDKDIEETNTKKSHNKTEMILEAIDADMYSSPKTNLEEIGKKEDTNDDQKNAEEIFQNMNEYLAEIQQFSTDFIKPTDDEPKNCSTDELVPIFVQKNFPCESPSVDLRKTLRHANKSTPNHHYSTFGLKNPNKMPQSPDFTFKLDWLNTKNKERLEILRIAAEKFIKDTKDDLNYSVPKKKIKMCYNNTREENVIFPAPSPGASTNSSNVTPRTDNLLKKIIEGKKLLQKRHFNDVLLTVTVSECEKLLELDKKCLEKFEEKLVKLPPIVENCAKFESKKEKSPSRISLPKIDINRPVRRRLGRSSSSAYGYDPFEMAQRQFIELLDTEELKCFDPSQLTSTSPRPRTVPTQTQPIKKAPSTKSADLSKVTQTQQRVSVIEPPICFKDSELTDNDDFELIENMINSDLDVGNYLSTDNRKYSDDMTSSSIDPSLINENDNLLIPDDFNKNDDYDIDPYSAQFDKKIEPLKATKKPLIKRSLSLTNRNNNNKSVSKAKNNKKVIKTNVSSDKGQEMKKSLPVLKRSQTLLDPSPSPKPSFKTKQEVEDFFNNGNEAKDKVEDRIPDTEASFQFDEESLHLEFDAKELFSVDDEMYEEYKKYEAMYLQEKEQQKVNSKKTKIKNLNYGLITNNEEDPKKTIVNSEEDEHIFTTNDSAYGSLRKPSARHRVRAPKLAPLELRNLESTSSSGSETGQTKLSKFCYECGTKFPVSTAKFCVECGVKRLVL